MKELKDILYKTSITSSYGDMNIAITGLAFDSRQVMAGFAFVAVKGTTVDGHEYIQKAVESGAVAIVCEKLPGEIVERIAYVTVRNSAMSLAVMASNFYGNPSEKLRLVGVTGTNGKTTVATLLYQLFTGLGYRSGLISTVENRIVEERLDASHTTPDALTLNALLKKQLDAGCTHTFMEVSSHAIVQDRVAGLQFSGGIFTNITHDHLDYHKTFENYIKAKKKYFDELPAECWALVNADDKRGVVMLQNTKASKYTFGLKKLVDFKAKVVSNTMEGLELEIGGKSVWFKLIGAFNAYNLLAVYATAILMGEESDAVLTLLSILPGALGRFEQVLPGSKFTAIVDYAHTPDALKNVLETINEIRAGQGQLITVVGCGGDRDRTKRPLMASIACRLSDRIVLTSDNPRSEDPIQIIREMQKGILPGDIKKTVVMADREEAIKTACMMAGEKDIVLVAGKGHEAYQEIKGVRHPFDDREVVTRMIKLFSN